ncbi:TraR/DksA family transcriptional regulator [Qipengyuania flava]|uniref:TraR/DksA family transcriptional regulator n=1 Tax=Qipengyuania flava TaxID=192812 RepID=UPI001C62A75C|nr:TraR/DksA family transcriptional regulator [Qipengyuania flava]QYJ08355.1 TraR/DksA family transcriptional regulator [Qipengyuania flava]
MTDYSAMRTQLQTRLADLLGRAEVIEDDLRQPLDADFSEQAVDLSDDEALEGIDEVLRTEIGQIRLALLRIENGSYGICSQCGNPISQGRLEARPIATRCIDCAS